MATRSELLAEAEQCSRRAQKQSELAQQGKIGAATIGVVARTFGDRFAEAARAELTGLPQQQARAIVGRAEQLLVVMAREFDQASSNASGRMAELGAQAKRLAELAGPEPKSRAKAKAERKAKARPRRRTTKRTATKRGARGRS